MGFLSVLTMAQRLVAERTPPGAIVVDATAGGGVDTLFLARIVGPGGRVYAFDVQAEALARTRARLEAAQEAGGSAAGAGGADAGGPARGGPDGDGTRSGPGGGARGDRGDAKGGQLGEVELLHAGHERMAAQVPAESHGRVRAVMFNLGYLPGGSGSGGTEAAGPVVTRPGTTVAALDAALTLLAPGGIATIVVYPGHDGGRDEADAVDAWIGALPDAAAQALLYRFPKRPDSPYLYALEKK